jgi:hypothetical protein
MPTSGRSSGRLTWTLVLLCVALTLTFGLAVAFDEDGDLGVPLGQDDGPSYSPDEAAAGPVAPDARRPLAAPSALRRLGSPGLLAAVPGGLCLLD